MQFDKTDIEYARELDQSDPLAAFREEFVIPDPDLIYLDGNSLGRLPKKTQGVISGIVQDEWGERMIRSWNEGWMETPYRIGAQIASLAGAREDELIVADSTSINLFKLVVAGLMENPDRRKIISDRFNFPSDLYILQGIVKLLGDRHELVLIDSQDGITIFDQDIDNAIDQDTALVCLTHVAFKSAFMYNMQRVTELAHRMGALTLWDLSHSIGAVPLDLNGSNVDLAIGCTYKYLNGGPGSPAFLYIRRDLQERMISPIWGWFGAENPFEFDLAYNPSKGISRFQVGTPPILSMRPIEAGLELLIQAGMDRLRAKSIQQTEYLTYLADEWLLPIGFSLGSPRDPELRGSHISLRHPEAYRINRAMIESPAPALKVIPDFREPDNIRLGIAPIYTRFSDINLALRRIRQIVEENIYSDFSAQRELVT